MTKLEAETLIQDSERHLGKSYPIVNSGFLGLGLKEFVFIDTSLNQDEDGRCYPLAILKPKRIGGSISHDLEQVMQFFQGSSN